MSTTSARSWQPSSRRIKSVQEADHSRSRAGSRAAQGPMPMTPAEVYSYALRAAYLHYLLQPRKKRKEYVKVARPPSKIHASAVGDLLKELTGSTSSNVKLPHSFRQALEKRIEGILRGIERLPGFNDAAVKRTFGEAYTAFTERDFRKTIDKDRKLEPLVLIFYTSANKAQAPQQRSNKPEDQAWKLLVDKHLALFVRLVTAILRDHGNDRDKPELMNRLATLEKKLLTNDQDLYLDTGQDGDHKTIEVEIPLTHEVKDMPLVQFVATVFARDLVTVQNDIDTNRPLWTEENAMKDLKAYQHRLNANMSGALRRQDFDLGESFDEWKRSESKHLTQMMLDLIAVRPELKAVSTSALDNKPLPGRPQSMYSEDQAYADLGRLVQSPDSDTASFGFDGSPNIGSMTLDDSSSIRSVDEAGYTFIPPDPRQCYKQVLQLTVLHDVLHPDQALLCSTLSNQSENLLVELSARWRLPQYTRQIIFLEVVSQHFLDKQLSIDELSSAFDFAKEVAPEAKKSPPIQFYANSLGGIPRSHWPTPDTASYRTMLSNLNDALLRDILELLSHCYEPKPPSIGMVLMCLMNNVHNDESFSQRKEEADEFSKVLTLNLRKAATDTYRSFLEDELPRSQEDWDFSHIVKLGQRVIALCEKVQKRYRKNPQVLGVSPYGVLVDTILPVFEGDAQAIYERIQSVANENKTPVHIQDGFDLYKELVEIRKIHVQSLPGKPFAFSVENLLEVFVWRWIENAEMSIKDFVEQAVNQDQFQVRTQNPDGIPSDDERHSVSIMDIFALFKQTVDQVFQLGWDDDVHHARFMTALARSFAAGIGRYCEIVDQKFSREMDRPSAQEAAAASKTTQERFMQYAKDALSTKEKIEPFQFYPESFVKLNNIEYAMQALDKLEKMINVDGCVDVLTKADGPVQAFQKASKFVFTIKIVEAEDLKACDPTGTSDPYVVLCDEYQKRLAKTRIIMRTLNPRWDESVDIDVVGPLNLIATIWDYDTFGEHDFVGRTSLKLDPKHFSDYLPREFWLDLDTQGRMLIRVSMEGERDDIQFYFAKAFRHLKRTERDMVRKVTDKLVTHINASLSHDALKSLLSRGIASSVASLWQKRTAKLPALTQADIENALKPLFDYFNDNFAVMKQTLTNATMLAVMTRLWKEVLMAIENLLVPPLSDKPSTQKLLTQTELDVVYKWLELLFEFFNAADEHGEAMGVPAEILKSPKWHELASLNFFYFEDTAQLIRTSEGIAKATAQRAQQQLLAANSSNRMSAPAGSLMGGRSSPGPAFASMGTIRRGKSIMMSRNLGTMRKAKEERRKEAQADPSDDMILRILRMRPEAAQYLKERHRQKERMAAQQAAAAIVRQSVHQGWTTAGGAAGGMAAFGGAQYNRNNLPRR